MKRLFFAFLIFIPVLSFAQRIPASGFNKVRIAQGDKIIQAEIDPVTSLPDAKPNMLYYWYFANSIHTTQGGFSGKLLNGIYSEYYINKNLKEQGCFKNGLKDGTWKNWNENGTLSSVYTWKNGFISGLFVLYNDQGQLTQSGKYHNNLYNGKIKQYKTTDSVITVNYKKGKVVTRDTSSHFWKKINIFNKFHHDKKSLTISTN